MTRRQNDTQRQQIVQEFLATLTDQTERAVCYLFMNNYTDKRVCRQLNLTQHTLELLKLKFALALKQAGIKI
ncbi:MAG: hypothetical protein R3Y15_00020 [Rikenellaceae bacterium]